MKLPHQVFAGLYPTGIVYSDRCNLENGDYKRLAFLSYATLELVFQPDCPARLRAPIKENAKLIQDKRGQLLELSACGQTVQLGDNS